MTVSLSLAISLIFSAAIPVNASAKEPIFTNDIGESRKLLYGEKETFISCWSATRGTVYLDVKVNGKWKQKAKSSIRRDAKNCSDTKYPGASKLIWTPDELSRIKGVGRTYILEIRERYGSIVKPEFVSSFTIPIYRSSSDLINDVADQIITVPKQAQPVSPNPTPAPVPVPVPIPVPTQVPTPPSLSVGQVFSGIDSDNPSWKWVAVRISNTSSNQIFSHRSFNVLIADSSGGISDTSFEPSFPILGPNQSAWYVTTQFNDQSTGQVVFQKQYSTTPSPFLASELPTTTGARLITSINSSTKKMVAVTVRNNSSSQILSKSSTAYAVLFNESGVPVYATRGFFDKAVLPGGSVEVLIGGDFTFNGSAASIAVTIATVVS